MPPKMSLVIYFLRMLARHLITATIHFLQKHESSTMTKQRPLFWIMTMLFSLSTRHTSTAFHTLCKSKRFSTAAALASSSQNIGDDELSALFSRRNLRGVIFDMDGTLVQPCIDFGDMRRRIYSVASRDFSREINEGCVLELAEQLSPSAQEEASRIFHEIETDAIERMQFMNGMIQLCEWLDQQGIQRAVLTRNVERSVDALHDKLHLPPFRPAVARNTLHPIHKHNISPKPHPDAIHYICQHWNCSPSQVIMVGDSLKDDVVAANRAGCTSVFLDMGKDNCSGNVGTSTLKNENRQ